MRAAGPLDSVTVLPCWYLEPLCDVKIVLARLHIPICVVCIRLRVNKNWMNTNARKYGRRTYYTALPSSQCFFCGPDTSWTRAERILVHVHVPCRGEMGAEKCGLS